MTFFESLLESVENDRHKIVNSAVKAIKEVLKKPKYKKYSKTIALGLQDQYQDDNNSFMLGESDEVLIAEFPDTKDSVLIYEIPEEANKIFNSVNYKIEGFEYCFMLVKN